MKIPRRNNKSSSRVVRYDPYALAFLKAIQVTFKDKKEKHNEIVKLVKDFKARGNSSTKRMKELLKGHTNLILLFNTIMPKEHRITLSSQLETKGRKVVMDPDDRTNNEEPMGKAKHIRSSPKWTEDFDMTK
ncbi:paired amphipathic helix protein SIN3 4-like [Trifolium pratense]|uniref:Paired amphipathic helix protein SIN3 4-like n=1 Tax=Trifolium pratense TaxID=57577 RepID=A0A2K3JTL7_TRIPR|nr:paired amphipathic helix protein SIN3 4-like [Trifolium pratense]